MNGTTLSVFAFASTLLLNAVANAQTTERPECTRAILNGTYGLIHDGIVFGEDGHLAEVGVVKFDGQGHWSHEADLISQSSGLRHISSRDGTYTVKPDCTGTAEVHGSQTFTFEFVILDGGNELMQISARPDRAVTWEIKKQNVAHCTTATLSGTYGLLQNGFDAAGNARAGLGVVTFDGKGTWSLAVTEVKKDTPIQHITNPHGTYTVNADCRGSASLGSTPLGTANWAFVIVDHGKEVFQIVTTPPRGVVTWILKRQFSQ